MLSSILSFCQYSTKDIHYYLPVEEYDQSITTPESYLGYQIGEWHVSHDLLVKYMYKLSEESDRISIETYGYSHEERPLLLLTISAPENHTNLKSIQADHLSIVNSPEKEIVNLNDLPAILYQGYSIHGDEASGSNAALLTAYYLAASSDTFTLDLLNNVVILFDPCYNPDGVHRFSTWVNSHKSTNLNPDEKSIEFHERWPTGRGNHYWFDLNRDWLLLTHPESKARITKFHQWYPNVLTDHHEMGKHSTFFFQPGVPERTNLLTPQLNQDLTEDISHYHAKHLDSIGSKYFSKERFDDYYYGKGSTYPDALGGIGILFEQAGVEGHLQETQNGLLSFPFAIRNQIVTSFSTWEATLELKDEIMDYKVKFFKDVVTESAEDKVKGYKLTTDDRYVMNYLKEFMSNHNIDYTQTTGETILLPSNQPHYKLIKSMMEPTVKFPDSIFYDVSTWHLPMAFGLECEYLDTPVSVGFNNPGITHHERVQIESESTYSFPVGDYSSNQLLFTMLQEGIDIHYDVSSQSYIFSVDDEHSKTIETAYKTSEVSLSKMKSIPPNTTLISNPKVGMLIGNSANGYDAGAIWHQFDQRWNYHITLLDITRRSTADLGKYDIIIMPSYISQMPNKLSEELKQWIKDGGKLIGIKSAINWAIENKVSKLKQTQVSRKGKSDRENGILSIGGSILNAEFSSQTNYGRGYEEKRIPVFIREGVSTQNRNKKKPS